MVQEGGKYNRRTFKLTQFEKNDTEEYQEYVQESQSKRVEPDQVFW